MKRWESEKEGGSDEWKGVRKNEGPNEKEQRNYERKEESHNRYEKDKTP